MYGHFEYNVMPSGFTNAHVIFQHLMNDIFQEFLDDFVVCYLDDILLFSRNEKDHEKHVRMVLQKLRDVELYAKLEKCVFHQPQVEFLGYIISGKRAFLWTQRRFIPLWNGGSQRQFEMSNISLVLQTSIDFLSKII
jgi:hypothetical protein